MPLHSTPVNWHQAAADSGAAAGAGQAVISCWTTSSGQTLAATNENERLEPASLTKLMSAYAVFHALKDGRIKMTDMVTDCPHARASGRFAHVRRRGHRSASENLIQGIDRAVGQRQRPWRSPNTSPAASRCSST